MLYTFSYWAESLKIPLDMTYNIIPIKSCATLFIIKLSNDACYDLKAKWKFYQQKGSNDFHNFYVQKKIYK